MEHATQTHGARRPSYIVGAAALVFAISVSAAPPRTDAVVPPPVPGDIQVPAGSVPFMVGHAVGTQNYVCLPSGTVFKFVLFTPQATLFNGREALTTHYFSPNPQEDGAIRATWQHAHDGSTVWGQAVQASTDSRFVAPGAIAWVLLKAKGRAAGSPGGDTLMGTTYIQRVNTTGGSAPASGCSVQADVGAQAFVPYTADYFFFTGP
jgi:hypothetical protein